MKRRILASVVLGSAAALSLTGCLSGSDAPAGQETDVEAAWLDDGRIIAVVTSGSSTCVPTAESAEINSDGALAVELVEPDADTACTRDLVPRATLVTVPNGVDPSQDLEIWVTSEAGYYGDVTLAGASGLAGPGGETDYEPTAGWTQQQGQFVILTWGSSGCVPVVESSEVTGEAEVTVTFQDPPADQVCTADMAPRTNFAFADGLSGVEDVQLVLTGDSFDQTITIYGASD
ncbi:MAG: hypothetical protein DSY74_01235 [Actinobacteria bacterium]|uniref:hypothetical protein n=1 Tax=unclassified Microbacterium TaxID=2609290 RepID=UPI000C3B796D|nr:MULTISPECIES: hypothetical protein [unclassified Microbacterium]RUA27608.1 MAG: hypothetical protein DSY74_01235 [Actinomycetota bacterium]MBU19089.1 hypothetical protein [Microbacterium sp.]HAM12087.1 hypothetical protein [Microbacterium sp.]HBS07549.1 hypothetical protein [Microbacterium sp.]HBU41920.1 hypothetical protein [Microbacterium sp.]|tara:strand:+ start:217 stop:915 length:699 start_codon:yes stop_codon:yes gene_type:complete